MSETAHEQADRLRDLAGSEFAAGHKTFSALLAGAAALEARALAPSDLPTPEEAARDAAPGVVGEILPSPESTGGVGLCLAQVASAEPGEDQDDADEDDRDPSSLSDRELAEELDCLDEPELGWRMALFAVARDRLVSKAEADEARAKAAPKVLAEGWAILGEDGIVEIDQVASPNVEETGDVNGPLVMSERNWALNFAEPGDRLVRVQVVEVPS